MNIRYVKARLQTRREYDFWTGILNTPAHLRTRAQRKHVQTRQRRGRIVALETLIRGGMWPAVAEARKTDHYPIRHTEGQYIMTTPDLVAMPASAADAMGVDYARTGASGVVEIRNGEAYELTAAEYEDRTL
jgi:hypothetical protein